MNFIPFRWYRVGYRFTFLVIALLLTSCGRSATDSFESFLVVELQNHPLSKVQDIYKLLYQGSFGVGHLLRSRDDARNDLYHEMSGLQSVSMEPLLEACNMDESIVRVNLRPFLARGLSSEKLVEAMMLSAELLHPDTLAFSKQWELVGELIRSKRLPYREEEYRSFSKKLTAEGYVPFHQSQSYSAAYTPAYRVVLRKVFDSFFPNVED